LLCVGVPILTTAHVLSVTDALTVEVNAIKQDVQTMKTRLNALEAKDNTHDSVHVTLQSNINNISLTPGSKGAVGSSGNDGSKGAVGSPGKDGSKGAVGSPGKDGSKGAVGSGSKGATGQKGDVGVTATPPPGTTPPTSPCTKTMGPDKVTATTSLISH
jgi:hypothetical protein